MGRTPDRRPGPSFEEESILFDGTIAATVAGEVRYDGSAFSMFDVLGEFDPRSPASSENAIVQARRTTTLLFPDAWADVGFNETNEETDDAVLSHDPVTNNERITFERTGNYRVNYELNSDQQTTDAMESRLFLNNTTVVPGSPDEWGRDAHNQLHNARLGRTILISVTAGDFITVQIQNTGSGGTVKIGAVFSANALTGQTGPQGPAGSGITDEDAIHDNVAAEISALALVTAAAGDHVLIEDASDSDNKKRVAASDFLGGGGGTSRDTWRFALTGKISVSTEIDSAWVAPRAATVTRVTLYRRTAGSSGVTTVDVHKGGTTIFTTQGNRPSTSGTGADQVVTGTPDVTAIAQDDRIEVDIDVAEAGNPQDLAVIIEVSYP